MNGAKDKIPAPTLEEVDKDVGDQPDGNPTEIQMDDVVTKMGPVQPMQRPD